MSDEASATASAKPAEPARPSVFKEVVQPFVDLVEAPRALWGVNLAYTLEGLCYFGILNYLVMHFEQFIFKGVAHPAIWAHDMVGVLTAGIAISMVVLGFVPDKWGPRPALIMAFVLLLFGRVFMAAAPSIMGLPPAGLWSPLHLVTMGGIVLVLIGYGVYQPAAYAAVRQFTTPKTAAMGYAMLYALMNAGIGLAMLGFVLRDKDWLGLGITGTFWVYTALTVVSLLITIFVLSKRTVAEATAQAKAATEALAAAEPPKPAAQVAEEKQKADAAAAVLAAPAKVPVTAWVVYYTTIFTLFYKVPDPWHYLACSAVAVIPLVILFFPDELKDRTIRKLATHPLADARFFCFIFALMPVQTLFTYNWFVLPQYIQRSYEGKIGQYFEIASNINPVLIFVLVPMVAALTYKKNTYTMMIIGTAVMSASAFFLALGATPLTLGLFIVFVTLGEALWQPRFLGYATEIAPEGRAGAYQGVAQLPWFFTKALVPLLYSGAMMERYCPAEGPKDTKTMWLICGLIAVTSTVLLVLLKGWIGKDFKAKAA